ncbi:MAG: hypothetical protein ACTSPG_02745 [Candidatus Hodarchaeales archaeon]
MKKLTTDRYLKLAYIVGGVYDLILGTGLLFFPDLVIDLLNSLSITITKPTNMIFVQISSLFLMAVGYYLVYAAYNEPVKFAFIGFISAFIRFGYAVIIVLNMAGGIELGYIFTAMTDSLTGILLLSALLMTEGVSITQIWHFE